MGKQIWLILLRKTLNVLKVSYIYRILFIYLWSLVLIKKFFRSRDTAAIVIMLFVEHRSWVWVCDLENSCTVFSTLRITYKGRGILIE